MSGNSTPGPACQLERPVLVGAGTSCRAAVPLPGSVNLGAAGPARPGLGAGLLPLRQVGYVERAWGLAVHRYVREYIQRQTSADFLDVVRGLLATLLVAVGVLLVTTGLGAVLGGIAGSVIPGAGTAAGATAGAHLGLAVGSEILEWLGVGFLLVYMARRLHLVGEELAAGIRTAWNSGGAPAAIDAAARRLANAVGLFFSLLLQALLVLITEAAAAGRLAGVLQKLRNTRLFKSCDRLEEWLNANYVRLMFRYKIKSGIRVVSGGGVGAATLAGSLQAGRALLGALLDNAGRPRFRSVTELDGFLKARSFQLLKNEPWGPRNAAGQVLPDARQLIYQGPENVLVKIKTMGYEAGRRKGVATMSVEVTDGKGLEWDNTLCKLDAHGKVIAKNLLGADTPVVPGADGRFLVINPQGTVRANGRGEPLPLSAFEVLEGGGATPVDKNAFADRGHLDFPPGFNPSGAASLK